MLASLMRRFVLIVSLLLVVAPALGATHDAASRPVVDLPRVAGVSDARTLIRQGRLDAALAILRPLSEAHPNHPNVLFLNGLAAVQKASRLARGDAERDALLDEAVHRFRAILIDRPELVRVRLELARAFFLKGRDTLAREHFERVLAGDLPPPVIANVQRFLANIRARKRWSVYFGASLAPDSNIGAASDERIIQIFGLPFRRDAEELTTSGWGSRSGGAASTSIRSGTGSASGPGATSRAGSTRARASTRPTSRCTPGRAGSRARGRT